MIMAERTSGFWIAVREKLSCDLQWIAIAELILTRYMRSVVQMFIVASNCW